MQAASHSLLLQQICLLPYPEDREKLCSEAKGSAEAGKKYEHDCIAASCPYSYSPHDWDQPCPTCD
jgi:hypothetical protein